MAAPPAQPSTARPARRVERVLVRAFAAAAICVGIILAILPYQRVLLGYLGGEPRRVESSCPAPIVGVFGQGDRLLASDGRWTGEPPCRRSSAGRLGAAARLPSGRGRGDPRGGRSWPGGLGRPALPGVGGPVGHPAADRPSRRSRQP